MSSFPEPKSFALPTPLGLFALSTAGGKVRTASLREPGALGPSRPRELDPLERELEARVRAYFEGRAEALEGALVEPEGTPFQRAVWDALRRIPMGEVRSYGELARTLGRAGAARAVGGACAANPVVLFVPCHRAVGAEGALTGYAFGLARKRWLIAHEKGLGGRMPAAWFASAGPSRSSRQR